jgi:adenylate cyclase
MNEHVNGELVPVGGGDPIPLIREILTIGRRETCDIRLPFPDVSGRHCQLIFRSGYWFIRDLNSTNGVKVNGARVQEKLLHPKDEVSIGRKRRFTILYAIPSDHRLALEEQPEEDILAQTLLQRAGLEKPPRPKQGGRPPAKAEPTDFVIRGSEFRPDDDDDD